MKKNNLVTNCLISLICLSGLASCNDIFNEVPISELSTTNFYKTEQDAVMAITGCYAALPITNGYHYLIATPVDELTVTDQTSKNIQLGAYNNQLNYINNVWAACYSCVYRSNTVLERIPPMNISDITKNRVLGEAKFLRAFSYFQLVRMWGDIPMITESVKDVNSFSNPKSPADSIYQKVIIPDLKFAITNLPQTLTVNDGRASKDAARGLLASVYLTLAGNDNSKQDYWKAARDTAYNVIANRGGLTLSAISLQLCHPYGDLFKRANYNHPEHIFAAQKINATGYGTQLTTLFAASFDYTAATWIGTRYLSTAFYNSFEKIYDSSNKLIGRDDRLSTACHRTFTATELGVQHNFFWPGSNSATRSTTDITTAINTYTAFWGQAPPAGYEYAGPLPIGGGGTRNYNFCRVSKYDSPGVTSKDDGGANIPLIRYSEILLIYAEAENEINPSSANALIALNGVRERAKLADKTTLSQDAFREAVLTERKFEFFAEYKRYFDLIRRGRYISTMNALYPANLRTAPQYLLFPIPFNEMQSNTKLVSTDQNPGW